MNLHEVFSIKCVQLALLTLAIGTGFWAIIWLVLLVLNLTELPVFIQVTVSYLGAGVLVSRLFANRIF